jgi:hypothetical protein
VIVGQNEFVRNEFQPLELNAFRWTADAGMESLGRNTLEASGVSADGSIVVGAGFHEPFQTHLTEAFRWTQAGGTQFLGVLPGMETSVATAVSDDGQIVIGVSGPPFAFERAGVGYTYDLGGAANLRAFYWTEAAGMQDLTQLLEGAGADLEGDVINAALGMSGDGEWIHGVTTVPDPDFPEFPLPVPVLMSLTYTPADVLAGDYNGSGLVEQADLDLVLLNWGQAAASVPGDWVSGSVDQEELDGVLLNWGLSAPASVGAVVPEPAAWLLCMIAVALLPRRLR